MAPGPVAFDDTVIGGAVGVKIRTGRNTVVAPAEALARRCVGGGEVIIVDGNGRGESMPIYEYSCRNCGHHFELLVRGQKHPACPSCRSEDLERLLSLPGVSSEGTRDKSLRAAKKRDKAQARDRMHDRLNYERSHDRHG